MNLFNGRLKRAGERPFAGVNIPKSNGIRIAKVTAVHMGDDQNTGTIDIDFVDGPGSRNNVIVTQYAPQAGTFPDIGDFILIGFSSDSTLCFMIGYLPRGIVGKLDPTKKSINVSNPGDQAMQGILGQSINLLNDGRLQLNDGYGGIIELNQNTHTTTIKNVNLNIITEAGTIFMGLVKRTLTSGFTAIMNHLGFPVNKANDIVLAEFVMTITDKADSDLNTLPNSVVEIRMGNIVSDNGQPYNKKRVEIKVKNDNNRIPCSFIMNNDGSININADKINLIGDSNNNNFLVKFNELKDYLNALKIVYDNHQHASIGAPPAIKVKSIDDSVRTENITTG